MRRSPNTDPTRDLQQNVRDRFDGVVVIIPARNEEAALPLVLRELPPVDAVIVVDNGSTDATPSCALRHGAEVVFERHVGYGSACLAGLAAIERTVATGCRRAPTVVVFIDADHSDHADFLPQLVAPILADEVDFVVGSRIAGQLEPGAMTAQSIFGNRLACLLMQLLWGARYTDLGPFRAIRYEVLRKLQMSDRNFGWTIEMQIKAVTAGLRIAEIPVPYRRRVGVSKISGTVAGTVKAGAKILYTIAKYSCKVRGRGNCDASREPVY